MLECPICYMDINNDDKIVLKCGHTFHRLCLFESLKIDKLRNCPYCRQVFPPITCREDETFIKGIHKNKVVVNLNKNYKCCQAILKSGSRKGMECGTIVYLNNNSENDKYYCKRHSKNI